MASFRANHSSSVAKTNTGRARMRRFLIESLENRLLLAADIDWTQALQLTELEQNKADIAAKPSYYYTADGLSQPMVVLSDRLALDLSDKALDDPSLLSPFGLSVSRPLDQTFSVYVTNDSITDGFVQSLKQSNLFDQIVPVFGMVNSSSEAVLLNEAIIALPDGVDPDQYFANDRYSSYRHLDGTPDQFVATLSAGFGVDALAEINEIGADASTTWVAPNFYQAWQKFYIPNDPRFTNEWHLNNTGQGGGLVDIDTNVPEAWDVKRGSSASIVVGVVDDGVPTDHPDLLNWVNVGEIPGDGIDNDGNGWIDDVNGWNFVADDNVSFPDTASDAHGTAVAGVAAARGNNGIGVVGPAYGSPVISARIFQGNGVASDANIASAIYYTSGRTKNGLGTFPAASIVNHSWGGGGFSTAIEGAVTWATTQGRNGLGAPQLFATGNGFGAVSFPATLSATSPGTIAIGAINNKGEKSDYSNFGSQVDVVTPSNDTRAGYLAIDTTDRIGTDGYAAGDYTGTGATGFGGTSSATPLATGIGALALSRAQQLGVSITAAELKSMYRNNTKLPGADAYPLPTGRNDLMGYGLLNAQTLLEGIGSAQISLTTDTQVLRDAQVINIGQSIVDGTYDVAVRIRNQGTLQLDISTVVAAGSDFSVGLSPGSSVLQIGEYTTFTARLKPTTTGIKFGTFTVVSNDPSQSNFVFHIVSNTVGAMVSGYVYEDFNGDMLHTNGELGLAGQTVFVDGNSNGVLDYTDFTNNTPVNFVDLNTVTSTLNVTGMAGPIQDINVTLNGTHTWVSDLVIDLVSPQGTRVRLIDSRGGSGDDITGAVFDDAASVDIADGAPPFTGVFRPETPLSVLNGELANGTWTIEATDQFSLDTGQLLNWTLSITDELVATTDAAGFYFFPNIPLGPQKVISVTPAGYIPSGPDQYDINVTSPTDEFRARDFGVIQSDRVYALVYEDFDRDGVQAIDEPGLPNQTITVSGAQIAEFTTSAPVPVVDDGTVDVPITVPAGSGLIQDIQVELNITHTWVSDLDITLISPTGATVLLASNNGGSGDNYLGTVFDDDAAASIDSGAPPFTGVFRPEEPLLPLVGTDPSGTWLLRVRDTVAFDAGVIEDWTLRLWADVTSSVVTGPTGWASVAVLPGVQDFQLVAQPNWIFTSPATGQRTITTVAGGTVFDQTFGTRPVNLPPTIDLLPDVVIPEDYGTYTVDLTGITAGRGDPESLRISVSSDNAASLTAPVLNYAFPDTTGTVVFDTVPNESGVTVITVTVEDAGQDNDFLTSGDNLTSVVSFTVTVQPVNDPPEIDTMPNLFLDEDDPKQTLTLTGINAGPLESQALKLTVTSSNTTLIPTPRLIYSSPNPTGSISFTPAPNRWGTSTITVFVDDAGLNGIPGDADDGHTSISFDVIVAPINDVPTLDALPNLWVDEDAPPILVSLSGITAGPLESQNLRVLVSSSNTSLIPTPTLTYVSPNATGQIVLVPQPDLWGQSVITVVVEDAGLDNQLSTLLDNLTVTRQFTITVAPVADPPSFDPVADIVITEDTLNYVVDITGINTGGGEVQPMRIIAKTSQPEELVSLDVAYTSPDATGTVTINTLPNQFGTFFMTLVLEDGGLDNNLDTAEDNQFALQTVSITILPVNDAPTLDALPDLVIDEDAGQQTVDLTGISSGPFETESLIISAISSNPALIPDPALAYLWPSTNGQIFLTPAAGMSGTTVITLTLEDAGPDFRLDTTADNATLVQTFTVTVLPVNDSPTIDPIPNVSLAEDDPAYTVNLGGITAGDGEVQDLKVTAVSSNHTLIADPGVSYVSPDAFGELIITPLANQSGSAVITVTVEDGGLDNDLLTLTDNGLTVVSFTVSVAQVNDPPTLAAIADVNINEDAAAQSTSLTGISSGIAESQPIRVTATSSNTALIPNPQVSYSTPDSTGSLVWAPLANQNGFSVITVTVEDGGLDQNLNTSADNSRISQTFTITVNSVNDAPSFDQPVDLTILEDSGPVSITLTNILAGGGEVQNLRVTASSSNIAILPAPVVDYVSPNNTGTLTLTPKPDMYGTVEIYVTVEDGGDDNDLNTAADNLMISRTITVDVQPINDAPTIDSIANLSTNEDTDLLVDLSGISAGNFENEPVEIAITINNTLLVMEQLNFTSGDQFGSFLLSPAANQSGQSVVTVRIMDGGLDGDLLTLNDNASSTVSFTVTVNPINDLPTIDTVADAITPEDTPLDVLATGITAGPGESQQLKISAFADDSTLVSVSATLDVATGTAVIHIVPAANMVGSTFIAIFVEDGGLDGLLSTSSDNAIVATTFSIATTSVNDAPTIAPIVDVVTNEDQSLTVDLSGISAGPSELQEVRITATSLSPELLSAPTVSYFSGASNGQIFVTPIANEFGEGVIEVIVEDAGEDGDFDTTADNAITVTSFTVTVSSVNDAPSFDAIPDQAINEDSELTLNLSSISAGPNETQPLRLSVSLDGTSQVISSMNWQANDPAADIVFSTFADRNGPVVVYITVEDPGNDGDFGTPDDNGVATQSFTINVAAVNDSPTIDPAANAVIQWNSSDQTILVTGISAGPFESDSLRVTASSSNSGLMTDPQVDFVTGSSDATIRVTPQPGQFGVVTIRVTVEDGGADGDLSTEDDNLFTMTSFDVLVNAAPTAVAERIRTSAELSVESDLLANDLDPDGNISNLSIVITQQPSATDGIVEVVAGGFVRFVPAAGFSGITAFSYQAIDQYSGMSAETQVLVGVGKSPKQNPWENLDVNGDSVITASDSLQVINLLNDSAASRLVEDQLNHPFDIDVNGDGRISPTDALLIINYLNDQASGAEGESVVPASSPSSRAHDMFFADQSEIELSLKRWGRRS